MKTKISSSDQVLPNTVAIQTKAARPLRMVRKSLLTSSLAALCLIGWTAWTHGADGVDTWRVLHRGGPSLRDVDQRDGLLIAVGGAVLTSRDEINWTSVTVMKAGNWEGGAYSVPVDCREVKRIGDRFVLFGTCIVPDGTGQGANAGVFVSSNDGLNWGVTTGFYGGRYGVGGIRLAGTSGLLLAVGGLSSSMEDYGVASATSDGMTWQTATLPHSCAPLRDACLQGPVKVAVGGDPLFSQNAPDWRAQILTSACGVQWTFAIQRTGRAFRRVGWGNGRYVVAADGATVGTSEDGTAWSFGTLDMDKPGWSQPAALVFGNGLFLLLLEIRDLDHDTTTQRLFRSVDGAEWTEIALPSLDLWQDLAYGSGVFVAVGEHGALFTSDDGLDWIRRDSGVIDRLNAVRHIDRRFLIVGDDGVVLSSAILPLKIRIARSGTSGPITLSWTGVGVLEEATAITGPWMPAHPQPAANRYSVPNTGSYRFYRVVDLVGVPAAPSGLIASAVSPSRVDLAWTDNSNNETGFKVERSGTSSTSGFTQIATVGANVTTYSSTGLSADTRYWYRIRASNASGDSAYSNTASTITHTLPQDRPVLTGPATSEGSITLVWTYDHWGALATNHDGYELEEATSASGPFTKIFGTAMTHSTDRESPKTYIFTRSPGTYWYRVRAYKGFGPVPGFTDYSAVVSVNVIAVIPGAPSNLSATAVSASRIDLSWTDRSTNETGFKVERSSTSSTSGFSHIATVAANVTTYSSTGLSSNTQYWYRVRASNAAGDSAFSNTASARTLSQIQSVTLYPQYDNSIAYAHIEPSFANTVYSSGPLYVGVDTAFNLWTGRNVLATASLAQFNTAAITGKTIDRATLELTVASVGVGYDPRNWNLRAIADPWSGNTVTWNIMSQVRHYVDSVVTLRPPSYRTQVYEIDVTSTVRNWASGQWYNRGFFLEPVSYGPAPADVSFDTFSFYSLEEPTVSYRPKLIVTYR
jgi:hypothetical protein